MDVKTVLVGARALLGRPEAWTQKCSARNAEGTPVFSLSGEACSWCLMGALDRAGMGRDGGMRYGRIVADVECELEAAIGTTIVTFNDDPATTHADVLAALDNAIVGCSA